MIEKELEPSDIERKVLDLASAMKDIRSAQADDDDNIVEMKHAKLSRLELLIDDLKPVIDDIPKGCDQFDFLLSQGKAPRLWVDMTSFVRLAGDGSEYEFVKDTRLGRVILAREENRKAIGEHVTKYIAERVLERERMIEGDWVSLSKMINAYSDSASHTREPHKTPKDKDSNQAPLSDALMKRVASPKTQKTTFVEKLKENIDKSDQPVRASRLWYLVWFLLGLIGGGLILFALMWLGLLEKIILLVDQLKTTS